MVSLQSFVHFDVISMVHKSTDDGKLLSICFFYNNIDRFSHPFPLKFLGKSRAQVREKQITPPSRHIVTSFPWSVLLSREKSLNYCTIYIYISPQNCDSLYFPSRFKSSNLRHLKDYFIEQYSPLTPHVLRIQQPPPCNQPKVTL